MRDCKHVEWRVVFDGFANENVTQRETSMDSARARRQIVLDYEQVHGELAWIRSER